MIQKKFTAILLASLMSSWSAVAAVYSIDPDHSSVSFRVGHLVSKVTGRFTKFSGTVEFDSRDPSKSKASLEIEVASIDTGNAKRDEHLRSPDFFDAQKFPKIQFTTRELTHATTGGAQVRGTLTMHGVTKEVAANVEFNGQTTFMGAAKAGFTGKSKIQRKDFGIVWNKALDTGGFVLGEEVEITIELEATASTGKKKN